ncbi:MAG: glycosyltransferase family 2 protein, partial [Thermoleophilaceae bacterium]
MAVEVVIPTSGRPSLAVLLNALRESHGPLLRRVIVVDDRHLAEPPLELPAGVEVVRGPARGPAAARNAGWRTARGEWVAFLDDDVLVTGDWLERLAGDLATAGPDVAGSQG